MHWLGTQRCMLLLGVNPIDCSIKHCQRQLSGDVSSYTILIQVMLRPPITIYSKNAGIIACCAGCST